MRNALMFLAICLLPALSFAQDPIQPKYELNGELIEATLYHDNGMVAQTGFYTKDNKLQGTWTSYDRSGKETAVAQYDEGKKVGTWLFYNGDTLREVSYADNSISQVRTWKITDTRVVSN